MTEEAKHEEKREDSRKDESMPNWADAMMKRFDERMDRLDCRMDSLEKGEADRKDERREDRKDAKDFGEDPTENTQGEKRADSEEEEKRRPPEASDRRDRKDEHRKDSEEEAEKAGKAEEKAEHKAAEAIKEAEKEGDKERAAEREDRARHDAANAKMSREMKAQISELQARLDRVYREPSFEDRNAIAAARTRADSVYQGLTGQPASQPIPGESPIAYRKRLADGIRKHSPKFKDTRLDSLDGAVFEHVESQIYADATEAMRSPGVVPAGQLRAITRNDSGHVITEYNGDTMATWAPFTMGAGVKAKITKPAHA